MTKATPSKLALDQIVSLEASAPVATAAPALPAKRPYAVNVLGPLDQAMQKAAILIRHHGYVPCSQTPIQVFGITGTISMTLVQGAVDEAFLEPAAEMIADSAALEAAQYRRHIEEAAARQVAEAAKLAADAKRAALVATQRAQIAQLEAEISAALK